MSFLDGETPAAKERGTQIIVIKRLLRYLILRGVLL
ncbi:hypothetical protein SAMN05421736_1038 [Evansella caseinilytica]|uniref:Uncharacterized protein n=1 Tax=Evansella caseinilytica TaxID=1503961 RepID=A0A1H3LUS6_9BACI|nr:hypothetical protein SAMN05421736_1038 [Evansella caseinilytica]